MMCLGWFNRPTCAARQQVNAATGMPIGPGATNVTEQCPSTSWFWLGAAAIVGAMFVKGK